MLLQAHPALAAHVPLRVFKRPTELYVLSLWLLVRG